VAVARGFAAPSFRAVDAVADALQSSMLVATYTHVGTATDWRMRANKKVRDFATSAAREKSGCVWAVAPTSARPFLKNRAGCTGPDISAFERAAKPQTGLHSDNYDFHADCCFGIRLHAPNSADLRSRECSPRSSFNACCC
jgi:hypothetical protein